MKPKEIKLAKCPFCNVQGKDICIWLNTTTCIHGVGVLGDMADSDTTYCVTIKCPLCHASIQYADDNKIDAFNKVVKDWNKRAK